MKRMGKTVKMGIIALLSFTLFNSQNLYGQNDTTDYGTPDYKVSIGPKFGPTTTKLQGSDVPDNFYERNGLKVGAFIKYDVQDWMSFQIELMYHQMGIDTDFDPLQNRDSYWGLHYFQMPVLAKFQYPIHDMFYPNVFLGPSFAYMATNQADGRVYGQSYNEDKIQSPQPNSVAGVTYIGEITPWDVMATFGGGLDMEFGRFFVGGEYRYDLGLIKVPENEGGEDLDMKNRASSWLLSVGINF